MIGIHSDKKVKQEENHGEKTEKSRIGYDDWKTF